MGGLLPYLERVDTPIEILAREDDWVRAAREAVFDAYNDGLDAVEFRFAPWLTHLRTGLHPLAVIDAVAAGVAEARKVVDMPTGLIGVIVRDLGPEVAVQQVGAVIERRSAFCGIDLAGNEAGFPAELFAAPYRTADRAGLRLTAHAGEAAGPESVWDAVRHLHVERIGHGVRSAEDPKLMEHLAESGITLEAALTSNVQTGAAPSYAAHQVTTLLAHGVPVTLNTDNPRTSNITLSQEHTMAARLAGLSDADLDTVAETARRASFVALG